MGLKGSGRRRLTYANVTSTIALFIAVSGGTAFARQHLITGKQIAKGTITATNIKNGSLLSKDFKKGQIPKGAEAPPVPPAPPGRRAPPARPGPPSPTGR